MSESKKAGKARRQYTKEFKQQAVDLSDQIGVQATAEKLGISRSQLYAWRSSALHECGEAFRGHGRQTALETENARLQRELKQAKMEVEILKKATAFFAKESK